MEVLYEYRNANGQLHREDDPAIEFTNGNKEWYINGKYRYYKKGDN